MHFRGDGRTCLKSAPLQCTNIWQISGNLGWSSALVTQQLSMNADKYDGKPALEGKIGLTPILMF
jgi:hypothetical protein